MAQPVSYRPSPEVVERRAKRYQAVHDMIEKRNLTYPEFNDDRGDQTLRQYIDDSERRLNGYTLPREAQGKEDWQENIFSPVTRAKLRAVVAGVTTSFPDITFKAVNQAGRSSPQRAEFIKQMVNFSRQQDNPRLKMFWEAWEACGKGTVITYDGYRRVKEKVDTITSYDPLTGAIETKSEDAITEDRAIDEIVPLMELFIWDFYINDIQDQPRLAWIRYYDEDALRKEFGHYPNYKYVKDGKTIGSRQFESETESYYARKWMNRTNENDNKYEVIRYYDKGANCYEVWVNGVEMLKAPLLWGKRKKYYPFAKTIYEPFSNKHFFYGLSLPKLLQGFQDVDNVTWNLILDNAYRSLNPAILVGLQNKDLLDIEDELTSQDNKIYVPDVSQVRPMPVRGISAGDVQLLNMIRSAMDFVSVDPTQQGISNSSGRTAREVMIANERARELKGIFYMMLEDLWIQKTKLRVGNVLVNYMRPQIEDIVGEVGAQSVAGALANYEIDDVLLSDGSLGTLGVSIYPDKNKLPSVPDIEGEEEAMNMQGINYKKIAVTSDYIDEWEFEFQVVPTSLENQSLTSRYAQVTEKQMGMVQLYPEYVASNKDKLFAEYLEVYGETVDEYAPPAKQEGPPGESLLGLTPPQNEPGAPSA